MTLKNFVKSHAPTGINKFLSLIWRHYKGARFRNQGTTTYRIGNYDLEIPSNHPISELMAAQPLRDECIGVIAKHVSAKYPKDSVIDIGANVGDTAALISSSCSNELILVEASDFFFPILKKNAATLPNKVTLVNSFISDGGLLTGQLHHWGGTAFLDEENGSEKINTVSLSKLTDTEVCFIKTDTDGYDFKILLAGAAWLAIQKPVLLLENQVRDSGELNLANQLLDILSDLDYQHFIVWDDTGIKILATSSISLIKQLNHYLLTTHQVNTEKPFSNFDLGCFHSRDEDIYNLVCHHYDHRILPIQ